jgi:saccharopine dehydrogenase-like NADP-dependent oxidoreductase
MLLLLLLLPHHHHHHHASTTAQVIDEVKAEGGHVTSFTSVCGGLPAPEAADNPLAYKFSWSPRGVLTAAKNSAVWTEGGAEKAVPGEDLLRAAFPVRILPSLALEQIPNRDSRPYQEQYGLGPLCHTVYRGTLRYQGWCSVMQGITDLGLVDNAETAYLLGSSGSAASGSSQGTWPGLMSSLGLDTPQHAVERLTSAGVADAKAAVDCADCLSWLGVWSDATPLVPAPGGNMMDTFCTLLQSKLEYGPGERDMALMHHVFEVQRSDGSHCTKTSTFLGYGDPLGSEGAETMMAKTVGLTAAIGAELVLGGKCLSKGVVTPVTPDLYLPALEALENEGIVFKEREVGA